MKIKHKLIAAFLGVVLIPIITIIFINQSAMDQAITRDYQEKGKGDLQNLMHVAFPKLVGSTVNYINFMAMDANMVKAAYYANGLNSPKDLMELLTRYQTDLGLSFIELTDEKGKITFSTVDGRVGLKLAEDEAAKAGEELKEAEFTVYPYFGKYVISTAVNVVRKGKLIGMLHGGYVLDEALLKDVTNAAEIMLIDLDGTVVTSTGTQPSTLDFLQESDENGFGFHKEQTGAVPYTYSSHSLVIFDGQHDHEVGTLVLAQNAQAMADNIAAARNKILFVGVLFIAIACGIGFFVTKTIVDPLERVKNMIRDIAEGEGDLTQRIEISANDEIGELATWFNRFVDNLQSMVRDIGNIAKPLASSAEEMANIAVNTGDTINYQQSSVTTVATAMNEMVATVQETSNSAQLASNSTEDADHQVGKGREVVATTISSIEELAGGVERSAEVIQKVNQDTESVATVLDVIKGVAEQTNLLALNAAIEAARAGEQGRGFAVVADEVRTLAQRTQKSTEEIQAIIERLQRGVSEAVSAMGQSKDRANHSVDQAQLANEAFSEISSAVASVTDMVTQIASAAEQQTAVAEDINEDVNKISQAADQTSEGASQTTHCSEQLSEYAAKLQATVKQFKV